MTDRLCCVCRLCSDCAQLDLYQDTVCCVLRSQEVLQILFGQPSIIMYIGLSVVIGWTYMINTYCINVYVYIHIYTYTVHNKTHSKDDRPDLLCRHYTMSRIVFCGGVGYGVKETVHLRNRLSTHYDC